MEYLPSNEHPPEHGTPQQEPPEKTAPQEPHTADTRKAVTSLVLAVLSLASMIVTAPLTAFAMLATYPSEGPSPMPWVAPLVFFSLPLMFALPSLALAISVIKNSPDTSPGRSSAAFALCIAGLVFALALGPALDLLGNL
ncbi:hypothetical protein [Arthrobacter sp. Z4-13]